MAASAASTVALATLVVITAAVMYGVTTFLFAFSGGQSGMVPVVGYGAIAVGASTLAVTVAVSRVRAGAATAKWSILATAAGWTLGVVAEWLLSFSLGAG